VLYSSNNLHIYNKLLMVLSGGASEKSQKQFTQPTSEEPESFGKLSS